MSLGTNTPALVHTDNWWEQKSALNRLHQSVCLREGMENAVNLSNWLSGELLIASTRKQKCTKIAEKILIKNQDHLLYPIKYKTMVILSFLIGTGIDKC